MLRYGSKKQIKICVSKAIHNILSLLAYKIAIEELFFKGGGQDRPKEDCIILNDP